MSPHAFSLPPLLLQQIGEVTAQMEGDDFLTLFQKVAISLLIGALIGLEREHSAEPGERRFAGIRTFPLIAVFGCISGLLSAFVSPWILVACLVGFFVLISLSYVYSAQGGDYGATSQVSAVIVFLLGAIVYLEFYEIAVAVGVILMAILSLKSPLHEIVERVKKEDIYATLKFAIITAIILPALPDETMGPLDVLNPRRIWYFVVLIAAISFVGYVLTKVVGATRGLTLTGFLGGLVSSTAVTFTFSQRSKEAHGLEKSLAAGIILASTIMFPRVLILVAVVNPLLLQEIWILLSILTASGLVASFVISRGPRVESREGVEFQNPFRLKTALTFGVAFAAILFLSRAAEIYMGNQGVYLAASIAGITHVDAITLSVAQLARGSMAPSVAATAIIIAVVINTLVKAGIVMALGNQTLRKHAFIGFGILMATAVVLIVWMVL